MTKYERRKKAQMKITVIIHLANVNSCGQLVKGTQCFFFENNFQIFQLLALPEKVGSRTRNGQGKLERNMNISLTFTKKNPQKAKQKKNKTFIEHLLRAKTLLITRHFVSSQSSKSLKNK